MPDSQEHTIDHEPWNTWGLTPYAPDPNPLPPVSLCVAPAPRNTLVVIAYTEVVGRPLCDKRMRFHDHRERGKFGKRSPIAGSRPCPNRAVVACELSDHTIIVRCKDHTP